MRLTIIALILSIAALGLGSFATFRSLDSDEAAPIAAQASWSEAECENFNIGLLSLARACRSRGDCAPYADMLQAIAENCD